MDMNKTVDMIGPGGPGHCSKIACEKKAVSEYTYTTVRFGQVDYDVLYRWCADHDHIINPQHYPLRLKEQRSL
jgi:hypothetical protein